MMNMHEVVIKIAFLLLVKMYIFSKFCKMAAKTTVSEIISSDHATKREHADEYLNHITFVTWALSKNPKLKFCYIFGLRKNWTTKLLFIPSFHQLGRKLEFGASKYRKVLWNVSKKMKIEQKNVIVNPRKISAVQSCSGGNQRWNSAVKRWFCCSEKFAVQSWINAVQSFSGNVERWIRTE